MFYRGYGLSQPPSKKQKFISKKIEFGTRFAYSIDVFEKQSLILMNK